MRVMPISTRVSAWPHHVPLSAPQLDSPSGSMMFIVAFSCSFMRNTSFLPLMANLSIAYKEDIS